LPPSEPFSFGQWWNRLGISGRLMLIGAAVGIVSCLLPASSSTVSGSLGQMAGIRGSHSVLVVEDWRGVVGLLGFIATIVFCFLL
jgi:hypothetical protein